MERLNCIFHIYAKGEWLKNVEKLRQHSHIFNGKKIAAITYDEHTVSNQAVKKELPGFDFIEMENDVELRETASLLPLLEEVSKETGAVFYGHTKGNTTTASKRGAAIWRNVMYRELLENYEQCLRHLQDYYAVGIHKIAWPDWFRGPWPTKLSFGNHWMFAGTFLWFRADRIFASNWRNIPKDRYGAEAWISGILKPHEGKSVYQVWDEDRYPDISPYSPLAYSSEDRERWRE